VERRKSQIVFRLALSWRRFFITGRLGELVEFVQRSSCEALAPVPALQRAGSDVIPDHAFFDEKNPLKDVENLGWVIQRLELSFDNRRRVVRRIGSHDHFSDRKVVLGKRRSAVQDAFDHDGTETFPIVVLSFGETLRLLILLGILHSSLRWL
jgi:hypothetical protein